MQPELTYAMFKNYFLAKAFDVVGNGSYRKHLAQCKEVGDPWAVEMSNSVQVVQGQIRELVTSVQAMPQTSNKLNEICKDVMMSAQPPIKLHPGCIKCCITGRMCLRCLDLSKTHKGNANVYVDARFCFFFMLIWFCNKLEYIVRSITRNWLDMQNSDESFQELCCKIQVEMQGQMAQMHKLFCMAHKHVLETLQKYSQIQRFMLKID